mgnify:CR=1 FL=1
MKSEQGGCSTLFCRLFSKEKHFLYSAGVESHRLYLFCHSIMPDEGTKRKKGTRSGIVSRVHLFGYMEVVQPADTPYFNCATGILAACCQNVRAEGARIAYSAPEDGRAGISRVFCGLARRRMTAKAGIPLSFWPEARKVVRTTLSGVSAAEGDMLAICQADAVCAGGPDREKKSAGAWIFPFFSGGFLRFAARRFRPCGKKKAFCRKEISFCAVKNGGKSRRNALIRQFSGSFFNAWLPVPQVPHCLPVRENAVACHFWQRFSDAGFFLSFGLAAFRLRGGRLGDCPFLLLL